MDFGRISRGSRLGLALGVCLVARESAACLDIGDPCDLVSTWTSVEEVFTAAIPTDGVIAVRISGPSGANPVIELIEIEVTLDGVALLGALEEIGVDGVLAWRPEAPLPAGSTVVVAGTIHNVEFDMGFGECGPEFLPFEFEVEVADGPAGPLELPPIAANEVVAAPQPSNIDELVCCDGAFPRVEGFGCGGSQLVIDEGHCVPTEWFGLLRVELTGVVTTAAASMLSAELRVDGELREQQFVTESAFALSWAGTKTFCSEITLRNVATGEVLTAPQQCHGDAVVDQLGAQTLKPDSPLLAVCSGGAYVCESDEFSEEWDPDRCTPWPAEEGSTGGPTSGEPTSGSDDSGGGTSGGTTGGMTDPGTGSTGAANDGLVEHGCACASGEASWRDGWALLLLLAGVRRRRAQASLRARR